MKCIQNRNTHMHIQADRQRERGEDIYFKESEHALLHSSERQGIKISTTVYDFQVTQEGRDRRS